MEIFDRFEVVEPYPAVYDERLDALVIADPHIGIELSQSSAGMFVPRFQTEEILEELKEMQEETGASRLIVDGDLTHTFGRRSRRENEELDTFLNSVSLLFEEVSIVEGNHDTALEERIDEFVNVSLSSTLYEADVLFVHGDERREVEEDPLFVVIGHEHPALSLRDEMGVSEKVACFLYGELEETKLLVMPAFSKLANGTAVNETALTDLLSPYLTDIDLGSFRAVAVDREGGVFKFPAISKI